MGFLLFSPTLVDIGCNTSSSFSTLANQRSKLLATQYQQVAEQLGIDYIDASEVVNITQDDGIHWLASQHIDFANAIAKKVIQLNF